MNLQGETYMQELAEGAEPHDLLKNADKEVAALQAALTEATDELARLRRENGFLAARLERYEGEGGR